MQKLKHLVITFSILGILYGGWPEVANARDLSAFKRPNSIPESVINPQSFSSLELGRGLFFDPRLSGGNSLSCAGCHLPEYGYSSPLSKPTGENGVKGNRHTPNLFDLAWQETFAWDGRIESLEGFILGPIQHPNEMQQDLKALLIELSADAEYVVLFREAYGSEKPTQGGISLSIASYLRTLRSEPSSFDNWVAGHEDAISEDAKKGYRLFVGKAGCSRCHSGWRFTNDQFYDTGLSSIDLGRGGTDQGTEDDIFAFRTASLRNVAYPPYMHDGSLGSLEDVVNHYNNGGVYRVSAGSDIQPLNLEETEIRQLVLFLKTLGDF